MEEAPELPFSKDELRAAYGLVMDPETVARILDTGPPDTGPKGVTLDLTTLALLSLLSDDMNARVQAFTRQQSFPAGFLAEIAMTRRRLAARLGRDL